MYKNNHFNFFVAAHKIILFVSLIFLFLCSTFLYETNEYQSLLIPWNKNAKVFLLCFYFKFEWCLLCASLIVILPFSWLIFHYGSDAEPDPMNNTLHQMRHWWFLLMEGFQEHIYRNRKHHIATGRHINAI